MSEYPKTERNKVVRSANRASYDQKEIFETLDAGFLCHVAFERDGQPFMIPTAYGRKGDKLFIHGSVKSRTIQNVEKGIPVCLAVTHVDGLVLARSAFHHSVNYRSAIIYGTAKTIEECEAKNEALFIISENILKGRWDEAREPNEKELDITAVLEIQIESASAKVRSGDPVDDKEDYDLDIWAGILPLETKYGQPISDEKLKEGIEVSGSAKKAEGEVFGQ